MIFFKLNIELFRLAASGASKNTFIRNIYQNKKWIQAKSFTRYTSCATLPGSYIFPIDSEM